MFFSGAESGFGRFCRVLQGPKLAETRHTGSLKLQRWPLPPLIRWRMATRLRAVAPRLPSAAAGWGCWHRRERCHRDEGRRQPLLAAAAAPAPPPAASSAAIGRAQGKGALSQDWLGGTATRCRHPQRGLGALTCCAVGRRSGSSLRHASIRSQISCSRGHSHPVLAGPAMPAAAQHAAHRVLQRCLRACMQRGLAPCMGAKHLRAFLGHTWQPQLAAAGPLPGDDLRTGYGDSGVAALINQLIPICPHARLSNSPAPPRRPSYNPLARLMKHHSIAVDVASLADRLVAQQHLGGHAAWPGDRGAAAWEVCAAVQRAQEGAHDGRPCMAGACPAWTGATWRPRRRQGRHWHSLRKGAHNRDRVREEGVNLVPRKCHVSQLGCEGKEINRQDRMGQVEERQK